MPKSGRKLRGQRIRGKIIKEGGTKKLMEYLKANNK